MTPRLHWFVGRSCALASFAYAARMKRLGHNYFFVAVAALYSSSEETTVVYGGAMPAKITAITPSP